PERILSSIEGPGRRTATKQTEELAAAKRQWEISQREFNRAHGLTPAGDNPSRAGQIRRRGGGLGAEIARDGADRRSIHGATTTPRQGQCMRKPGQKELNRLHKELRRRTGAVDRADQRGHRAPSIPVHATAPAASHARGACATTGQSEDTAEPASPHPSRHRTPEHPRAHPHKPAASGNSGAAGHHQAGMKKGIRETGAKTPHRAARRLRVGEARQPARSRLGPRVEPADARDRLDRLVESRIAEEEGPAGPKCFGPRILNEPMIDGFQLPRDTPKYDGTAKPEDWLQDYSTAVGIAKGNKRWAVRYSPLMLLGSARTWLNNLPAGSINGWLDFEDAFISNFTGTYRRPGRPQQLEMCKQGPDETDRAYLTRWCEMRNSCEGVHEIQAVGFFMAGCRPNTMLVAQAAPQRTQDDGCLDGHRRQVRAEGTSSTPAEISPAPSRRDNNKPAEHKPAEGGSHGSRRDNYRGKRHSDQPDRRYGSAHVAAVSDHAAAGGSRRQKQTDRPWKPKYTFEQMLDSPCKYHSGKNPSNHTTRDCHFMKRLTSGEPLPPPPPPRQVGARAGSPCHPVRAKNSHQVVDPSRLLRRLGRDAIPAPVPDSTHWKLHFDGSKMRTGLGAGVVITSPKGDRLDYVLQIHFAASNNVAEYEALIHGLKLAKEIGVRCILCFGDSDLVIQQASGDWDAKDANMASYRFHVQQTAGFFEANFTTCRANNEAADALSKIGSTRQAIPPATNLGFAQVGASLNPRLHNSEPGASAKPGVYQPKSGAYRPNPPAQQPNPATMQSNPEAPKMEALMIERRAKAYTIINHQLYKRSVSGVFQRCVEPAEGIELLREIHQGECGHHASSRAIVGKAFRHGFYWPTAKRRRRSGEEVQRLPALRKAKANAGFRLENHPHHLAICRVPDMVGPFKTNRGGMTHLLVMIDKFTKWIEAKPIKKLDGSTSVTFLKEIIVRYGYPHSIITDNGSNFAEGIFKRYCGEMGIRMDLSSVAHPETNGQVKANGLILAGIRPRLVEPLERSAGCWIEELPSVLWSLRTTQTAQSASHHSSSCTGPKPSCRLISSTTRQGSSSTQKPKPKKLVKMESTWSKRPGCWLSPDRPYTSKASDAITAGRCSP
ncbi:hypothetical protein QYE76_018567, partial [Lolium multiflorum]